MKGVTDAQAMRWARAYFKAAFGERWGKPPKLSQLAKLADELAATVERMRVALREPLATGAADTIIELAHLFAVGEYTWEDDDGQPVSDSEFTCYGEAFVWAAAGATREGLRLLEADRRERMAQIEQFRSPAIASAVGGGR